MKKNLPAPPAPCCCCAPVPPAAPGTKARRAAAGHPVRWADGLRPFLGYYLFVG